MGTTQNARTLTVRARVFRIVANDNSTSVTLELLQTEYQFDADGRRDRRGLCLEYRTVSRWVPIMENATQQEAEKEARASWRMYPVSAKRFTSHKLPRNVRRIPATPAANVPVKPVACAA
jgi:hypothetical protein